MNIVLRTTHAVVDADHGGGERGARGGSQCAGRAPARNERGVRRVDSPSAPAGAAARRFAGLALLLAAIGTYGVLSYSVLERRREIGIRMALGAKQGSVLAQIMKQGLLLAAVGVAAGLAGAFALSRVLSSLLFGVQPTDPATMAAVVGTIAVVATVACGLPAWRASRVDPIVVLRDG